MEALERLEVWKRSSRLCVDIYKNLDNCTNYGFKDQIGRAALSIPSNIAEGYERDFPKERIRFLRIAKGSCGEVWTQLNIGIAAGFIEKSVGMRLAQEVAELSKMLQGLVKHYQKDSSPGY